ncbi:MAG: LPXTG cell wall anchor domain-containing protein [Oscillospiraceae bacterium]|nr:LPXTG cell wall anchor domain-containing protein [Oscillospiraceae bacterium]
MKNMCFKRYFAAFLSFIILTAQCALPIIALSEGEESIDFSKLGKWDDSMHFVVRHWHAVNEKKSDNDEESGDGSSGEIDDTQNFTYIEGYIVPKTGGGFNYYVKVDDEDMKTAADSEYIKSMGQDGKLVLNTVPLDGEKYAGTSISAGHSAVTPPDPTIDKYSIEIQYNENIHLTKCHVFYISKDDDTRPGTNREDVFGENGLTGTMSNPVAEYDTAYVYVYNKNVTVGGETYEVGDIVVDGNSKVIPVIYDDDGNPVVGYDDKEGNHISGLPVGINEADVEICKFYNTKEGLHTDKTASVTRRTGLNDGRTFDLTLESWYSGVKPVNVGMIVDASGSMAWTSDDLDPISIYASDGKSPNPNLNLTEDDLKKLEAKKLTKAPGNWNDIFLTDEELNWLLDPRLTANSPLGVTGYSYYVFDERTDQSEYAPLAYWDGKEYATEAPEIDEGMIGWYTFDGGSLANKASTKGGKADLIVQQEVGSNISFNSSASASGSPITDGQLVIDGSSSAGIKLDVEPSEDFTVSFAINKESGTEPTDQYLADLMYIGALNPANKNYLRVIRESRISGSTGPGGSVRRAWLTGYQGDPKDSTTLDQNDTVSAISAFHNIDLHYVTYVFKEGKITSYFGDTTNGLTNLNIANSTEITATKNLTLSGRSIIFNGFKNQYNGKPIHIDDIKVYDKALTEDEVKEKILGIEPSNESEPITFTFGTNTKDNITNDIDFKNGLVYKYGNASAKYVNGGSFSDGFKSTNAIQVGGGMSTTSRVFVFTPPSNGTITVYFETASSSSDRGCRIQQNGVNYDSPKSKAKDIYSHDVSAGSEVYIGSSGSGLNIYGIVFTPSGSSGSGSGSSSQTTYSGNQPIHAGDRPIGFISADFLNTANTYAGWYYMNPASDLDSDYYAQGIESSKELKGIEVSQYADFNDNELTIPTGNKKKLPTDTVNAVYVPTETTPTKFYIDKNGYLRCFFSVAKTDYDRYMTSYVYESPDNGYIKVEALQRAAGAFTTKLLDYSPSSKISAVRFSARNAKKSQDYLDKLVMLDWTSDTYLSTKIFSLNRAGGGTILGDTSINSYGLPQYNYGLTGGTYTWTGLLSYIDNLDPNADNDADKYLIIFTDGKDNVSGTTSTIDSKFNTAKSTTNDYSHNNYNPARAYAKQLRDKGYTIYAAMLTGGSIAQGSQAYKDAKTYLGELTGDEKRVYTTDEAMNLYNVDNSADALVKIFEDEILEYIVKKLENYTVQDYIDPRFDLVDSQGRQWHLNAGGSVTRTNTDGTATTFTVSDTNFRNITVSNGTNAKARLHYDSAADMYYLRWVDQTIPGSSFGATDVPVWSSTITVRAKDDFLGGNAVLSNGNAKMQNLVYDPLELDGTIAGTVSSGTDDSMEASDHPSKGFPRTTVNVGPVGMEDGNSDSVYMGQPMSYLDAMRSFIENAWETEQYYWNYIARYAASEYYNGTLDDLLQEIINNNELTIPYYYLPDEKHSNSTGRSPDTGKSYHEGDCIGSLTYYWSSDAGDYDPNAPTTDTDGRKTTLNVTYTPLTEAQREGKAADDSGNQLNYNEKLVTDTTETDYKWDSGYKPTQGQEIETEELKGEYEASAVSGEIILEMVISKNVIDAIRSKIPSSGIHLEYYAKLFREYDTLTSTVSTLRSPILGGIMPLANTTREEMGKFEINYTIMPDTAAGGDEVVYITLSLSEGYNGDYYNDDTMSGTYYDGTNHGLPYGTYTVEPDDDNISIDSKWLSFGSIEHVTITGENQYKFKDNNGVLGTEEQDNALGFRARADKNTAWLGTWEGAEGADYETDLLKQRYALFWVPLIPETTGELTITKFMTEKTTTYEDQEFEFTITLDADIFNYEFDPKDFDYIKVGTDNDIAWSGDGTGKHWTGTVKLKKGESITIKDIPAGVRYEVEETDKAGFYLNHESDSGDGLIRSEGSSSYVFVNSDDEEEPTPSPTPTSTPTPTPPDLPNTGGKGFNLLAIIGGALTLFAAGYVYSRKKKFIK